jgi:membrane-associated phospholipid phosphatase
VEVAGKQLIALPLPATLRSGMTDLECPQMQDRPQLTKVAVAFGFVNQIASPSQGRISWSHTVSAMPLDTHTSERAHSYPGGHAARWGFVWWLFAWLAWRHLRARPWRQVVTVLLCLFALVGGFLQFYIGVHMLSDTLAGYLLGGALACCGIGILRRCEAKIT